MTVFSDPLFLRSELSTTDCNNKIICTLRGTDGRGLSDLMRNDTRGYCEGRLITPVRLPDWLVPETILRGTVQGVKMVLTYRGVVQSRISGLNDLLGDKLNFSYVVVTEFN